MNIRPMDLQIMIPRAVEAGKVHQQQENMSNVQQHNAAAQFQQSNMIKMKQVQHTDKSDDTKLNPDDGSRQEHSQRDTEKERTPQKQTSKMVSVDPTKGNILDILT